jgi:p-aminobenzoyl-glutamate transporter AbgT
VPHLRTATLTQVQQNALHYSLSAVLLVVLIFNLHCVFVLQNVLRDEVKTENSMDAPLPEMPAIKRSKPLTADGWYNSGRLKGS